MPDIKAIYKQGECYGDWSDVAVECSVCHTRFGCRAKTLESRDLGPDKPKTPLDMFMAAMRDKFYFIEMTSHEDCVLLLFSRNSHAVYVAFGNDGTLEGKVHGKPFDIGIIDPTAFAAYVEKIAKATDEVV